MDWESGVEVQSRSLMTWSGKSREYSRRAPLMSHIESSDRLEFTKAAVFIMLPLARAGSVMPVSMDEVDNHSTRCRVGSTRAVQNSTRPEWVQDMATSRAKTAKKPDVTNLDP